jgi:hypothetical protein
VAAAPAPREVAREVPAPVEHAAPAPKPVPGSLDDLMSSAVKKPARSRAEIDKRLAGINENKDEAAPRKKAVVEEAPAVHALTRTEIQSVMHGVQGKVSECYRQYHQGGPVDAKVTVAKDGSVSSVSLVQFTGTPTGNCVERAISVANFPESGGLRFDYRLSLR